MRHSFFLLVFLFVMSLSSLATAQGDAPNPKDFKEGSEYFEVSSPLYGSDDGRVEVLAFYWYNCGSCFYLEPKLAAWAAKLPANKVRFLRVPFGYNGPSLFHAQLAFALEHMNLGSNIHLKVFKVLQEQRLPIYTPADLPRMAQALNIDEDALIEAFESPEVTAKMSKLNSFIMAADINAVPSMLIDGKYRFDIGGTKGAEGFLGLADILIEKRQDDRD